MIMNEQVKKFRHPGSGRRKPLIAPKGRQVEDAALQAIQTLLAGRIDLSNSDNHRYGGLRRDHLIEYLHLIQDQYGHLSSQNMAALAHIMKLSMAEIYEVASFYAHFDIVLENDLAPPKITIRVCDSLSCMMQGGAELYATLAEDADANIRILRAPCMGRCHLAPVAEVGHFHVGKASSENIMAHVQANKTHAQMPKNAIDFAQYRKMGGYDLLTECMLGKHQPDDLIAEMSKSGLRGLGGAGFPTGKKWGLVRAEPAPRIMAVNGDEGEPGTFKDHHYLVQDPHRFLEGMLIAAWVVEAKEVYIYLRDEYPDVRLLLLREIASLEASGISAGIKIELRRGAGAYICGEESAMIESIEGKRGLPRHRPPFAAQIGLFGLPTLIHNVETLYWVRDILQKGASSFSAQGLNGRTGMRSFSVSGQVKYPGVKFAPAGITMKQLIADYCGGMKDGHEFIAYLPGGASGGILPARLSDTPLDFDTLQTHGCFIGSAAVIVLSDQDDLRAAVRNLMLFFEDESCGQCTPCRNGTEKMVTLLKSEIWDTDLMQELAIVMMDASICGLGQAAPNPLLTYLKFFEQKNNHS